MNEKEYNLFKYILQSDPKTLNEALYTFLLKKYKTVYRTDDYIYAIGDIPIALVAHMDTVFPFPPQHIYYDEKNNVIWSPEGLGADDRAGVFSIIKILQTKLRPTVIFLADEEIGALGACALTMAYPEPVNEINYIIELDRQGKNDCVFYDCDNPAFVKYVESFGFKEQYGSFSDISELCPDWGIAGVNLSIGYISEHTYTETLNIKHMFDTINKVIKMITKNEIPKFKYIPSMKSSLFFKRSGERCHICEKTYLSDELIDCIGRDKKTKRVCFECCANKINFCSSCGNPYVMNENEILCPICLGKEAVKI